MSFMVITYLLRPVVGSREGSDLPVPGSTTLSAGN